LNVLFPDKYTKKVTSEEELLFKKKIDRIPKILNQNSIKTKTASQLLNELDPLLARSGRYTTESVVNNERIFTFEIDIKIKEIIIKGYGKNKKIAKNEASKNAIKELYDIDIDKVLMQTNENTINVISPTLVDQKPNFNDIIQLNNDSKSFNIEQFNQIGMFFSESI
jgi:hypothetical protein